MTTRMPLGRVARVALVVAEDAAFGVAEAVVCAATEKEQGTMAIPMHNKGKIRLEFTKTLQIGRGALIQNRPDASNNFINPTVPSRAWPTGGVVDLLDTSGLLA
jgi:hypothetical protein